MNTRHILLCLALSLLGAGLQAQTDLPQVFSPNAAELGKYGKIPVSYFNGLPNITIPLTELKAKGYTLPIYLSYHASGNKPDQHPGWVGLGWSLHAGGCINRIVNGMKDEMTVGEYGETHNNLPTHNPGYYHHRNFVQQTDWTNGQVVTNALSELHTCDPDPDEFQVCLDEIQASFYLTEEGGIKIVSKSPADFKVEIHLAEDGEHNPILVYPGPQESQGVGTAVRYDYFDRITLTNSDGTVYVFGGDDSAIEYSMPLIPVFNEFGMTNEWKCLANANTWLLTRIERPNGEIISFTYTKDGTPIVRQDIHHSEFCHYDDVPILEYSFNTKDNPLQLNNISFSLIQPSYLTSIHCRYSADSLLFSKTRTTELEYATTSLEFEKRAGNYILTMNNVSYYSFNQMKAEDYYMQLSEIIGPNRHIQLSYTADTSRRLTLQQVSFRSGADNSDHRYTFDYDPEPLPPYHARQSDLWGFYNGINYSATHYKALEQARKQVNPAKAKAEILRAIHYPTGGWTEFDYEGHDYSKEITQVDISLTDINQTVAAGGLRIKEIRDYSVSGRPETRSFSYRSLTGLSSGILAGSPTLYASGEVSRTLSMAGFPYSSGTTWTENGFYELFSEYPIRPLSTTDGNHVTYSRVKETLSDGSCSIYQYTNHDEPLCCDTRPSWRISYTNSHILFNTFNSRELFRGLLLHRVDSSANGTIIRDEMNEYLIDTTQFIKSISIEEECNQFIRRDSYRKIPCAFPYLKTKTVTIYPDDGGTPHVETSEYTYDTHRRLTETRRKVGGVTERDTFTYTGNFQSAPHAEMVSRNMIALPVESNHFRKDTLSSEKVVSADLVTWKKEGDFYVPAGQWKADLGQGVVTDSFNAFDGTAKDSRYGSLPELSYTKYDVGGNLVLAEDRSGLPTTYFWTPDGCYPAAIFKGAKNGTRQEITQVVVASPVSSDLNELSGGSSIDLEFLCDLSGEVNVYLNFIKEYGQTVWWRIDYGTEHRWDWPTLGPEEELEIQTLFSGVLPAGNHIFQLTNAQGSFTELADDEEEDDSGQGPMTTVLHHTSRSAQPQLPSWGSITLTYPAIMLRPHEVRADECLFESFGPDDNGLQEGFDGGGTFTGVKTLDFVPYPNKTYTIDWQEWQPDGTWAYRSKTVPGTGTFTAGTAGKVMDHVRVFPQGTQVESYTWDAAGNLLSRTDARGVTESYRYDGLGRLTGVYDNDGKKVEGYQYNYKNR